jgi:CPA1 family monovalent cation:H+ antiporter
VSLYHLLSILLAISLVFIHIQRRFPKAQETIAITAGALLLSLVLIALGALKVFNLDDFMEQIALTLDFKNFLLHGILSFLLFAGALNINLSQLKEQRTEIFTLATLSTLLSTFLVACGIYIVSQWVGVDFPFVICLVFGALISPTDPIAVIAILNNMGAPKRLSTQIEGESLFNDGFGLVLFLALLGLAFEGEPFNLGTLAVDFTREAFGGIMFGLVLGGLMHLWISSTHDYGLEMMMVMLIPTLGYNLAELLGVSGALSMVVSGIIIGNFTQKTGFSDTSSETFHQIWHLIESLLNSVLFLIIGLVLTRISFNTDYLLMGLLAIPVVLIARMTSVGLPFLWFKRRRRYHSYTVRILTWGGLRGGLALAMVLSIPADNPEIRTSLIVMTYLVVLFSILVQGSTISPMIARARASDPT